MIAETDADVLRAIELARELPVDVPAQAHREQVRTSLIARASRVDPPRRTGARTRALAGLGLAAAAAVIAYVATRTREPAPVATARPATPAVARDPEPAPRGLGNPHPQRPDPIAHGHVHAAPGARLGVGTPNPDETIELHDGTIEVDVDPLGPGDRFRVIVGASEVEVRGTSFTVVAERDRLVEVQVAHGRVEVRFAGETATALGAGASWHAARAVAPHPHAAPPRLAIIVEHPAPPIPATPTPDQLAYGDGWAALREQRFHDAATAFARALALAPDGPLADDARYWNAVALARDHRTAPAISAFRELLDEHPGTVHRGEASAMLGWLLVDAKQVAEARTRFAAAISDPSDKVRASARAGLDALR